MGDLRGLIEAVERGEYHREDGPPKYLQFADDAKAAGCKLSRMMAMEALRHGRDSAAAILRALEAEGPRGS